MNVLIADNEPEDLRAFARLTKLDGHEVHLCEDGASALIALASRRFALAILDLYMPSIDAVDVCRRMRERGDTTLILVLTAMSDEMREIEALEAGADDFMSKTARPALFRARVAALLRRRVSHANGRA